MYILRQSSSACTRNRDAGVPQITTTWMYIGHNARLRLYYITPRLVYIRTTGELKWNFGVHLGVVPIFVVCGAIQCRACGAELRGGGVHGSMTACANGSVHVRIARVLTCKRKHRHHARPRILGLAGLMPLGAPAHRAGWV